MRHIPLERWTLVSDNPLILELKCPSCHVIVKVAAGASLIALAEHSCSIMERKPSVKVVPVTARKKDQSA
jgi:hypothetical protein